MFSLLSDHLEKSRVWPDPISRWGSISALREKGLEQFTVSTGTDNSISDASEVLIRQKENLACNDASLNLVID